MPNPEEQQIRRLGIFGGSFDPPHLGHLLLAEYALEQCQLDQIWFLPAAIPPHKQAQQLSSAEQRIEMLKLAIGGHAKMQVCSLEIERGGVSYTVDTLAAIHEQIPKAELFLLMGGDTLEDLPNWREPEKVCQLALPVVIRRPGGSTADHRTSGYREPDYQLLRSFLAEERIAAIRAMQVNAPLIEISSSEIRSRVAQNKSIRFQTPRAVEKYIEAESLYRSMKTDAT